MHHPPPLLDLLFILPNLPRNDLGFAPDLVEKRCVRMRTPRRTSRTCFGSPITTLPSPAPSAPTRRYPLMIMQLRRRVLFIASSFTRMPRIRHSRKRIRLRMCRSR